MMGRVSEMSVPEDRILRLPEVMRLTGLSKATIHRRYRNGTFPTPVRLGQQSIGWWYSEIRKWLVTRSRR